MTATAKPLKIILQGSGNIMMQARVAAFALVAGRPEAIHGQYFRVYESDPPGHSFVVAYNKASITVWPQPSADATAKRRETA